MFGGSGSIKLARIFGIRIGVDASWFLVLFFFIFIVSGSFKNALDTSDTVAYGTAVVSVLLFFVSLVLHELGHALVARRSGIEITGIDLWFFGGVAKLSRDTKSPGEEFKVAIAGPLVTLVIVGICVGIGIALYGQNSFVDGATLASGSGLSPVELLLGWLATINAFLLVFNLIPAFPLDGGRVARAIAWKLTGDRGKATRVAAGLGQGFAYILIGLGLAELLFTGSIFGALWLMVLGWFLAQAARGAVAQTRFSEQLEGVTVADIMDREPVAIPGDMPVARALDEYFLRYRWDWFPVTDEHGRFLGILRQERADGAASSANGHQSAGSLADPGEGEAKVSVQPDASVESLLGSPALRTLGALFAVDPDGVLRGVVTVEQVRRAVASAAAPRPAA